jgi:hypothetical protein
MVTSAHLSVRSDVVRKMRAISGGVGTRRDRGSLQVVREPEKAFSQLNTPAPPQSLASGLLLQARHPVARSGTELRWKMPGC